MDEYANLRLDADLGVFFSRQLEHVKARTYDIKYAELNALRCIPVSTEAGPGAESITYEQYDQVGVAKIIESYASDLPRADIKGQEFTGRVRSLGNAYGYSIQDIRAAQMAGKPLETRRASAARRANDEAVNRIAWGGDADHNLQGFLSNPNIPVASVPAAGAGSATTFASKTPDQIIRDMNACANDIVTNTFNVERPDTLLMPIAQYSFIASTPRSSTSDTTILEFFLRSNPYINRVEPVHELTGVGTAGADIMLAYRQSDEVLTLEIPQPFEQLPVQEIGLEFQVPCHSRIGGVNIYYPLAINIREGI